MVRVVGAASPGSGTDEWPRSTADAGRRPGPRPTRIHADRTAGTLELEWADGHVTVYDATTLRWLCPCAFCRGEAGLPGWLDSCPTLTAEQTRLDDITWSANYAIAPHWADGHHTGYYPFRCCATAAPAPTARPRGRAAGRHRRPPARHA